MESWVGIYSIGARSGACINCLNLLRLRSFDDTQEEAGIAIDIFREGKDICRRWADDW